MNRKKRKYIIGGVLIVGIVVWVFGSISSDNLTYYYTPSEVNADFDAIKGNTVRVMGMVKEGTLSWIPKDTRLLFQIIDDDHQSISVEYTGSKPDMLREGQGVVVEGRLTQPGFFLAENLLVKHNEDYKVIDHSENKESYYQTLQ